MNAARISITALGATAVKGLRVTPRAEVMLERSGARDNRRFYLIDDRGGC